MNDFESLVETKAGTSREIRKGTTSFQRPIPPWDGVTLLARFMPTMWFEDSGRKTLDVGWRKIAISPVDGPFLRAHANRNPNSNLFRTVISFPTAWEPNSELLSFRIGHILAYNFTLPVSFWFRYLEIGRLGVSESFLKLSPNLKNSAPQQRKQRVF